jgi:hypothetical protein
MAMLIASLFVEISARGAPQVVAATRSVANAMSQLNAVRVIGTRFQRQADDVEQRTGGLLDQLARQRRAHVREMRALQYAIGPVTHAFTLLSGSIVGFVAAGLRGTTEGNALAQRMSLISREIAGVFLPVVNKVIDVVTNVLNWFRNLTSAQQDLIMNLGLGAVAGLGLAKMLAGPLTAAITKVIGVVSLLIEEGFTLNTLLGGIPLVVGLVVSALAGLLIGTREGRQVLHQLAQVSSHAFKQMWEATKPVFALLKDLWDRLNPIVIYTFATVIQTVLVPAVTVLSQELLKLINTLDVMADAIREIPGARQAAGVFGGPMLDAFGGEAVKRRLKLLEEMNKAEDPHRIPTKAGGGFEAIAATWNRIQNAANQTAYEKETAKNTKRTVDILEEIRDQRSGPTPPSGMT